LINVPTKEAPTGIL